MAIDINAARFLLSEKNRGINFGRTLTLGRQGVCMSRSAYASFLEMLEVRTDEFENADAFFRGMGAAPLTHVDASDFEGAAIVHDMNDLVPSHYHAVFDTVMDGGTLEHVYNFPVAMRNCMEMVKPGGQLVMGTPWHNFAGHGFYQFSPELFYSTLSEENGYEIEKMLIVADGYWWSVKKPSDLQDRIEIFTADSVILYITARRLGAVPLFSHWPQQSDYKAAWDSAATRASSPVRPRALRTRLADKFAPIDHLRSIWQSRKRRRKLTPAHNPGLEKICRHDVIPSSGGSTRSH